MKIAKILVNIILFVVVIYLGMFMLWLLLGASCIQYTDQHGWNNNECRDNSMSRVMWITHAPLIKLLAPK
jgi:hypothetical protein